MYYFTNVMMGKEEKVACSNCENPEEANIVGYGDNAEEAMDAYLMASDESEGEK